MGVIAELIALCWKSKREFVVAIAQLAAVV